MKTIVFLITLNVAVVAMAGNDMSMRTENQQADPALLSAFRMCMGRKSDQSSAKTSLLVDTAKKTGYLVNPAGETTLSFRITIGSAGTGNGVNQTSLGLFFTGVQEGSKYQTDNPDPEQQGINIGNSGKILHSDHNNNTTAGCIGIQMDKWTTVMKELGTDKAPVFVSDGQKTDCGSGPQSSPIKRSLAGADQPGRN